jgi:type-IV secretion system protein TraC
MEIKNLNEDFANKAANLIGFNETDIETTNRANKALFDNSFYGGEPLRNYLNYRYFEPKSENFLLTNGSAGFMLEICPLVGVNDGSVKSLNLFISKELPKDGFLQFFLMASSDIDDFLDFWSKGRVNKHPILQRLTKSRVEYFRKAASDFTNGGKKLPRCFRIFVSYSKICKNHNEAALEEIHSFRTKLANKLSSLDLQPKVCKSPDLIHLCREFFELDPGNSINYKPSSNVETLNNQCLSQGNYYQSKKTGLVNLKTGVEHRAYNFTKTPDFWSLAQNIELLGSADGDPLPARFCLSLSIANDFKTNKVLIARGKKVIDSAERPYSRHDKALQEEAVQWRDIIHNLVAKGEEALSESFCLFLSAKEDDIDKAQSEVMTMLSNQSWEATPVDYFHLEAILGSLPMHSANLWQELKSKKLVQTALSSEIVSKLPIHGEWYGVPLSGVIFIGKRGQIFNWNPYHRLASGNFNINVVGPSGVGKSVFLQCLAEVMLAQNTRVFILDIGKSYASLSKLLGGEIIEFGALSTFTINPFAGLKANMSEIDFNQLVICSKELLTIMSGASGEYEAAMIEEAIKDAVQENNYDLDLDGFIKFLKASDNASLHRFATSLFSYSSAGVFGKYFSGNKPASFNKSITIFEFAHVKDQPKLISIILQTLLMQITSQFLSGDRSKKFMIIVDEAWMLMDHCAGFLAAIARNLRRYGGSLVVCTQCFADLQTAGSDQENNNHRKAIFENSAWKINLPPGSFTDFEAHSEFKHKVPLLKSLSFERGQYSEMLLSSSGIDVVGRLMLDKFSSTVFSTEGDEFAYLNDQESKGIAMEDAIDNLIKAKEEKL